MGDVSIARSNTDRKALANTSWKISLPLGAGICWTSGSVSWDHNQQLRVFSIQIPEFSAIMNEKSPFFDFVIQGIRLNFNQAVGVLEGKIFNSSLVVITGLLVT